jgi:nifR3 family TIM-barrel protein
MNVMKNVWKELSKPILALAPMEDVSDSVFRQIIASCAKPDIFFTEFMSCDGFLSAGHDQVAKRLTFDSSEHPVIAQIWGYNPQHFYATAKILPTLGFDGIDINMGCPQKNVVKDGACAALITNQSLAKEIIQAVKDGVQASGVPIPVSVKTRIGYKTIDTEKWISFLLSCGLDALIVHGRTAKEMSKVPAHWDEIEKAVRIKDCMSADTVILGNGDVPDAENAVMKCAQYGTDGAMIGRGVFDNPWAFDRSPEPHIPAADELLLLCKKHLQLHEKIWGKKKNYETLKKFFKMYIRGFDRASEFRIRAMNTTRPDEMYTLLDEIMLFLPLGLPGNR